MPMGATSGSAVFQRMTEDLLGPVRECADPFVDDIITGGGMPDMLYDELLEAQERDVSRTQISWCNVN